VNGVVQVAKAAPSTLHRKVAWGESEAKANVPVVLLSRAGGPLVIVVSGTVMFQVDDAGVASVPADVTARTSNVWTPAVSPVV
jgi:hypothetical protein